METSVSGTMADDDVETADPVDTLFPPASELAIWFLKDSLLNVEAELLPEESRPVVLRTRTVLEAVPPAAEPPDTLTHTCIKLLGFDQ
ncbi:hypothetical protein ATPR_1958 [Acetobacter tropicalis NBRC 101654]|uniref:Uncharacterized protein n=1 Tax=Acetobacter tropicalis NBRC 101654 TaxID=749388 RepID=F7VF09_9PROT|nr:hypothetical protein ATPR_1958 [Acetobacter tropicalis NBRC 101654]